jgi:hypothetical protein
MTTHYISLLHMYAQTHRHTPMLAVMSSLLLLDSSCQWQMFPFFWVPRLSPASATSFSQQQLTITEPQLLSDSLTHQPTPLTCPAYNISAQTAQKTPFLCCNSIVAMQTCLFAKPLLSNSCCILAYLVVVAQQRVYMPHYSNN